VLAADQTLTADARWLKAHGVGGTMDQLRARAFTARLTGQPLDSLLPAPGAAGDADPAAEGVPGAPTPGAPAASAPGWPAGPAGSVNPTMPAAAWLGQSDKPGQISGLGAAGAGTCCDVAGALARNPATRWCITLIGRDGRPVAHGCARAGPGPPGSDRRAWLATVTITPVAAGTCEHRRESAGYQPSDSLRHIIKIRSPRCGAPGCRRPAVRCDDDHTIPYDQGGRTCECNLYPLCRRHHQTKQARGWHLTQPEPGTLIWTTPSGRHYTTKAEPYPA
jgi:HNH endonuclease